MIQIDHIISCIDGLHARPAAELANIASEYAIEVYINKDGKIANIKNITEVVGLCAKYGQKISILINGDNEKKSLKTIKKYIEEKYGYEVVNYGTDSTERFNYPVSGEAVANAVVNGEVDKGIVICGTGVGISLAANKVNGIRCVTCSEPYSALLSRQHNNTNMLAFGARVVGIELAKMIVDAWLSGEYEGGRHQVRIDMLKEIEEKQKNK